MGSERIDLAVAEHVLGALQQHRSRDRVELVVDLGLTWDRVAPTIDVLIQDGYILSQISDGEPVFTLATAGVSRSLANIVR